MARRAPVPRAGSSGRRPWPRRTRCRPGCGVALPGGAGGAEVCVVAAGGRRDWGAAPSLPPREIHTIATPAATMSVSAIHPGLPRPPTLASVVAAQLRPHATSSRRPVFAHPHVKHLLVPILLLGLTSASGAQAATPAVYTGATGRSTLASWYYKADPANVGLAHHWGAQRFPGRLVTVPYVPNAWAVTGATGRRNFNGSVGWYRTTVNA